MSYISDLTSFFWSSPAPVSVTQQRPTASYVVNGEPFKTYHQNNLKQFEHHKDVLFKHDMKLAAVVGLAVAAWFTSGYSYMTTMGFILSGYSAYLDGQRRELLDNYRSSLNQLKSDVSVLDGTGVPWKDILRDKQVQAIFKALAPFVKRDDLKFWNDSDLKVQGYFGTESDRTDLDRSFVKLLDKVDSREFEESWQYKLYNSNGYTSIYSYISDNIQQLARAGIGFIPSLFSGSSSSAPSPSSSPSI